VTGGTGFIGSHTVEQLIAEGYHVRCLIRPNQVNVRWLQGLPVDFIQGDLMNLPSLSNFLEDAEYIIHIAGITKAKHKNDFYPGNVATTNNLLLAASQLKHLKKFCFISSLTAVGPSPTGISLNETEHCHPITAYGESKRQAECVCRNFSDKLPIVIIRPPAVFGPRDTDILEIFKWVSRGFKPILGSSAKSLSLVYAPDLAQGIIRATLDTRTIGETYNIADPKIYAFSSVIDYLATLVHKRTIQVYLPKGLVYTMAALAQCTSFLNKGPAVLNIEKARDLLQTHWVADPRKIFEHIGFKTSTSMQDGIEKTYHWYKNSGWL
jgi:nucleoside-diphosphate-sugar epimerase